MILGILTGLFTAFIQSTSYVFSKMFINKNSSAFLLSVYSQLVMGVFGLIVLLLIGDNYTYEVDCKYVGFLSAVVLLTGLGQLCFFLAAAKIEASRLSSFTSLKIVFIAIISYLFYDGSFSTLQWVAIILSTFAAIGMNFSGLKIPLKGAFWLLMMLLFYSNCDIFIKFLLNQSQATSDLMRSFGTVGMTYSVLGLCTIPVFLFVKFDRKVLVDSLPYAVFWFIAMLLLFYCFSILEIVFVNIIIAMRGIISVLLGYVLSKMNYVSIEPSNNKSVWIRRLIMSILMVLATGLYSYSKM